MRTIKNKLKKMFGAVLFTIGLLGLALPIIPGWVLVLAGLAIM